MSRHALHVAIAPLSVLLFRVGLLRLFEGCCMKVRILGSTSKWVAVGTRGDMLGAGDTYKNRLLAMTDMPKPQNTLSLDFSSFIGPLFFVWLVQLPLPWVRFVLRVREKPAAVSLVWMSMDGLTAGCAVQAVMQLVYETQHRLRSMMRMHGLSNSVYLFVMYLYV